MSNPAPTLNQINAFNATQGTTIDFNIIGGTEVIRSNKIYIYDLSDNSLICTHLYVSTESIHELPPNTSSSIVYESGKSSADFTNNTQYYAQIQTFTDVGGTQGGSGLSIAKLFWCLPTPTLTLSTIPTTISTTSYNVSATYTPNTSGGATNEIQEFQFNLYSAIGALLQTSGVVLYGEGVDLSYNFSGLEVDSTYYVTLDVTTTQGMNVSAQSNTFTVSIDTPTMGSASVVNNGCDGYISVTSNLSSEYEHEESSEAGEIMSFTTDSVNDITELDVDFSPVQDDTPWMSAQDTEPYMFRAVPSQTEDFGHESDCIVGGTVGWNQLFPLGSDSWKVVNESIDVTATNGRIIATGTPTASNTSTLFPLRIYNQIKPIYGHKYFLYVYGTTNFNISFGIYGTPTKTTQIGVLNGDGSKIIACETANSTDAELIGSFTNGSPVSADFHSHFVDLTAYFDTTIADYVYTLESGTAGAGVAWLRANAPQLFEYHAYDAGSLVSVSGLTSHDMVGFNQWDEEWEVGYIGYSPSNEGQPITSNNTIRSKNYIPVVPNTSYYFKYPIAEAHYIWEYDANKTALRHYQLTANGSNNPFTTPSDCCFIKFACESAYGTTYKHDICINLSDPSLNGTYKPYVKHSYPLDSDLVLRGIPKLDASNNLYYDGDVYESDGSVTRKYGIVDLGTLTWRLGSTSGGGAPRMVATLSDIKNTNGNGNIYPNIICTKYLVSTPNLTYNRNEGITTNIGNHEIIVFDANYFDKDAFKTAMNGVYAIYELATPTTETADPYTNPQIVDPSGTEEYVGSSIPVGHETTYQRICPISGWDSVEVDVVGVNVWDEEWELGGINEATGQKTVANDTIRSKNYISVIPNTNYYVKTGGTTYVNNIVPHFYDAEYNYISYINGIRNAVITTPSNAKYILFRTIASYGTTYLNDISINYPSTDTSYHAYNGQTYTSTFPKYKQQVTQDKIPYITKNIGDTYADTLTENLVGGTIAWNQSVPDTTTTHTVSGSIASMDDAVASNFESVVCDINPVQDLHGYDKPWAGGAGKNKFDKDYLSVFTNYTLTIGGYKYTDKIQLKPNTTYTIKATNTSPMTAGLYYVLYHIDGSDPDKTTPSASEFLYPVYNGSVSLAAYQTFTTGETGVIRFGVANANALAEIMGTDWQLEEGSTATAWTPYSNLCPITGWTGCEVDVIGFNQWDEEWELGGIASTTGIPYSSSTSIRSKNFCKCVADQTYYFKGTFACYWYDENQSFIKTDYVGNNTKVAPTNARYFKIALYEAYGTTYNHDICINLSDASLNGTYKPYNPNSAVYPVSWQTEAGTVYGGTVDLVTGVLTIETTTFNCATASWQTRKTGSVNKLLAVSMGTGNYKVADPSIIGEQGEYIQATRPSLIDNVDTWDVGYYSYTSGAQDDSLYFILPLDATPTGKVVYKLATPQTYQLDHVQVACLLGQNNVWNNISNTTVTYPTNHSYQSLSTTHKYYKRINGVESISVGSDVVANVGTDNIIDLTQMFGTTIADYIYNREQSSSSGMGVKFFKSLFPNDDYDYNSGTLISVNASAHVIKDASGNVLHTYPLDSDLVLRGIPKLDANNKLYYDGDVYRPNGSVTRKYGIVDLGSLGWTYSSSYGGFFHANLPNNMPAKYRSNSYKCGLCVKYMFYGTNTSGNAVANYPDDVIALRTDDSTTGQSKRVFVKDLSYSDATTFKSAMNGVYFVYELYTPTTEQADPFEENQAIVPNGIEEYTVTEQGDVEMPVGHDSTYYTTKVYGGTIDMAKGVLTINMVSVDLGTLNWIKLDTTSGNYRFVASAPDCVIAPNASTVPNMLCSIYPTITPTGTYIGTTGVSNNVITPQILVCDMSYVDATTFKNAMKGVQLVYELATPIEISLTPQQMQTLSGQNNIWSNTNGGMYLVYQLPITSLLVKRRDVADVSGKWLTLYSTPITQADDMDFTFIDFLNQYGKTYQYALVPVLAQDQSGVVVQIEGGYTVSDNVDSIFDGVYIADQTNVERVKAGVGYGNIDMNQGVGSITPIGSKYPIVITNSQNQYHNGSIRGTIVPNDFYSNGNLSRIDMVNKRDELEQFLTNKCAKIIKDWNGKMWLVMIMSNVACSFDDNYGMGMVSFSADWLEVGDPTNQQDLYNAGLINVGGV